MGAQPVVEALLFSAGRPLGPEEVAQAMGLSDEEAREALRGLAADYDARGSALEIAPVGGKWAMQIRETYRDKAARFVPTELSQDLLRTASLIAYLQPVEQAKLRTMLGEKVYEHVKALRTLSLVNTKPKGRTFEVTTTARFVEYFGLKGANREEIRQTLETRLQGRPTPPPPPDAQKRPPRAPRTGSHERILK